MTDRELLESAAKAAGIFLTPETLKATFPEWEWDESFETYYIDGGMSGSVVCYNYSGEISGTTRQEWHPLDDDGDALRLAVKLGFSVVRETIKVPIVGIVTSLYRNQLTAFRLAWEPIGDDAMAATRRAIVRAAAAIGEKL